MEIRDVLADTFGRIRSVAQGAVEGLDADALSWRVDPDANPISWLVWHLARVQDDHVAELAGHDQVWIQGDWAGRFGLPDGTTETGYGHTAEQVAAVRPADAAVLTGYLDAVSEVTEQYLGGVDAEELDRVIDTSYDPPVTVGVRLVSVVSDGLQHAGQAQYVRGMLQRTG